MSRAKPTVCPRQHLVTCLSDSHAFCYCHLLRCSTQCCELCFISQSLAGEFSRPHDADKEINSHSSFKNKDNMFASLARAQKSPLIFLSCVSQPASDTEKADFNWIGAFTLMKDFSRCVRYAQTHFSPPVCSPQLKPVILYFFSHISNGFPEVGFWAIYSSLTKKKKQEIFLSVFINRREGMSEENQGKCPSLLV